MNIFLVSTALLAFLTGVVHSILGEILIFRELHASGTKTLGLAVHRVGILWASWHMVTVLGWGFGTLLLRLSFSNTEFLAQEDVKAAIFLSMLFASLLVLWGTKGKHPGWLALLGVCILSWIG